MKQLGALGDVVWGSVLLATVAGCSAPDEGTATAREAITGGQVDPNYPAVGLVATTGGSCSGTLISKSWVLTAKHCGTGTSFKTGSTGQVAHPIDRTVLWYPSDSHTSVHDMALMHLTTPITNIRPLSIFTGALPSVGQTCVAVGYGLDSTNTAGKKRSATVVVDKVGQDGTIFQTGIDIGIRVHAGSGLTAEGDSGGPLLCGDRIAGELLGPASDDAAHPWYTALTSNDSPWSSGWVTHVVADDVSEPPVAAITGGPNLIDLFIRGTDGQVFHKYSTGSAWGPSLFGWEALGGYITGTPEAVTWGGNRIDVFVRGGDSNPATDLFSSTSLWDLTWDSRGWTWQNLGGNFSAHPSAVAWPQRVAVIGVGTDSNAYFFWWNGSRWIFGSLATDDGSRGVALAGPLKAVNVGNQAVIYALGTNSLMYTTTVTFDDADGPDVASTWTNLGGNFIGRPSVVFHGQNTVDLVARGTDGGVWHKWQNAGVAGWKPSATGWEQLYGSTFAAPVASSYKSGQITLIAPSEAPAAFLYKAWFGSGWYPSATTWLTLGGIPVESATLLAFPMSGTVGTIDAFVTGNDFTPSLMQYQTNGPSASYGWRAIASLGGTLGPW